MTKVKYIRISSLDQNTARQEMNSKNFNKVYIDKCSGAIKLSERKEGKKLIKHIEDGVIYILPPCGPTIPAMETHLLSEQ